MIVCPNCEHQNPDGALACEACYTPLPVMTECPSCHAPVQADASFCGQCGFSLQGNLAGEAATSPEPPEALVPPTVVPDAATVPEPIVPEPLLEPRSETPLPPSLGVAPDPIPPPPTIETPVPVAASPQGSATQLQVPQAQLLHVQTDTIVSLPSHLSVIHIGKPNSRIPPDIDVSGFPNSAVVYRVHADLRIEAGIYYIEDVGSSNGTYINHAPLAQGNRHRLRPGDRIALGKGDLMTFLFQTP